MKQMRSASAHNSIKSTMTTKSSPQRNPKVMEINNKINNMLQRVKNPNESIDLTDNSLQLQYTYSKILANVQKEKIHLMGLLKQKDQVIQEQLKKVNTLNIEVKNQQSQLQKYQQIPVQMEQLEQQCSSIIQENQKLKQQIYQFQTSFNFLQSQQLQAMAQDFDGQMQLLLISVNKSCKLLEYAVKKEYDNFQTLINLKSKQQIPLKNQGNLYQIMKDALDNIRKLVAETDRNFEVNYKQISEQMFYAYNN